MILNFELIVNEPVYGKKQVEFLKSLFMRGGIQCNFKYIEYQEFLTTIDRPYRLNFLVGVEVFENPSHDYLQIIRREILRKADIVGQVKAVRYLPWLNDVEEMVYQKEKDSYEYMEMAV